MIKLEKCLFCQQPLDSSKEHIIPNSMNGRLTSRDIICSKCNNFFGRQLDPVFKEFLNPLLLIFGFDNARPIQFKNDDREKYILEKNMAARPVKPTVAIRKTTQGPHLDIQGTPKQVKSVVESINKKLAPHNIHLKTNEVKQYFTPYIDQVKVPFFINTEDSRFIVSMWKMALEFAAYNGVNPELLTPFSHKVIRLEALKIKFCNFKNEVRDFGREEICHTLLIRSEGPILYVYMELFSIVCAIVVLSETYKDRKISEYFQQDALDGKRYHKPIKLKSSIVEILRDSRHNDNFEYLLNKSADRLSNKHMSQAMHAGLSDIMTYVKEQQEEIKFDDQAAAHLYVEEAAKLVAELDVNKFPYVIEDLGATNEDDYNFVHSNFRPEIVDAFIEENKDAIGKKVYAGEEVFSIVNLEKRKIKVRSDKELVTLYVILVDDKTGAKFICPIKEFLDKVTPLEKIT
jgi:hypothetical protein